LNVTKGPAPTSPFLSQFIAPWYDSLADPEGSQGRILKNLLEGYSKTDYGKKHGAADVGGIAEYRAAFPISDYRALLPYIARVERGEYSALLAEPPKLWVMTRGSTGASKVLPATEGHLFQILEMGARCVVNFALRESPEVLETPVLNLNFPSEVHGRPTNEGFEKYGYSSGTYARTFSEFQGARLVPEQREVDALGGGITRADWEKRFELAYQRARREDVGSLMGVTPVMVSFASYLRKRHDIKPKELWKCRALFCTSVAKIHTKYEPILRYYFGPSPVVEMYTATEGVFAQQLDAYPYVSPNYDGYLFEVVTGRGTKMLHEMKPNEWGQVVVSTQTLPRYAIGDLVEAMGKGYFRVFGRDTGLVRAEHIAFRAMTLRL
jgi:hypothetical protein